MVAVMMVIAMATVMVRTTNIMLSLLFAGHIVNTVPKFTPLSLTNPL